MNLTPTQDNHLNRIGLSSLFDFDDRYRAPMQWETVVYLYIAYKLMLVAIAIAMEG